MHRRSFHVAMVAVMAWPDQLHAQRSKLPTVGYLANAAPQGFAAYVDAFRGGLAEMGFVESRDVAIEYRWAEGKQERLQGFAEDLHRRSRHEQRLHSYQSCSLAAATPSGPVS